MHAPFNFYKIHVQHMLRETNLSNQVKIVKTQDTCTQEVFALICHTSFLSQGYAVEMCVI